MSGYSEYRHWSVMLGCDASRLSMFDEHGGEFFMLIPAEDARSYRVARETALDAIATAIAMGCQPGEVRVA